MTYTMRDRLLYPVIPTAAILAGTATGSCSGDQIDVLTEMRDWLAWRVEGGWLESSIPMAVDYDRAVRAMARAALVMYDRQMKHRSNTTFSTDTCDCLANVAPASDCHVCREANLEAQRDEALDKLAKLRAATKAFIRGLQKDALEADLMMCDQARRGDTEGCYIIATRRSENSGWVLCDDCAEYLAEEGKALPPLEDLPNAAKMRKLRDLLRKP